MDEENKNQILEGSPPNEDDIFYISWGRESLKNNLVFANEVLRQLVTLNSALLGGSIAFLDETIIAVSFKVWVIVAFFLSLIMSFVGMMPYEGSVDLRIPKQIKQHKEDALKSKRCYLWIAGILLGIGFGIALAGIIMLRLKYFGSPNTG